MSSVQSLISLPDCAINHETRSQQLAMAVETVKYSGGKREECPVAYALTTKSTKFV